MQAESLGWASGFVNPSQTQLSTSTNHTSFQSNSSGSLVLDIALGTGGFTYGRMVEVSGDTGTGKTTLALHCLAACQAQGGVAALLEPECAIDRRYVKSVGVDMDELIFAQPCTAENTFDIAATLIDSGSVNVIVIDSIAALLPNSQIQEAAAGTDNSALEHSRALAIGFAKLREKLKGRKCTVLFTNQLRLKPDCSTVRYHEDSMGGRPVQNFMATRIRLSRGASITHKGVQVGHHCLMSVTKNKDGKSGCIVSTPILYEKGLANGYETISRAIKAGLIKQTAAGYFAMGRWLGTSLAMAKDHLDSTPKIRLMIDMKLTREMFVGSSP